MRDSWLTMWSSAWPSPAVVHFSIVTEWQWQTAEIDRMRGVINKSWPEWEARVTSVSERTHNVCWREPEIIQREAAPDTLPGMILDIQIFSMSKLGFFFLAAVLMELDQLWREEPEELVWVKHGLGTHPTMIPLPISSMKMHGWMGFS